MSDQHVNLHKLVTNSTKSNSMFDTFCVDPVHKQTCLHKKFNFNTCDCVARNIVENHCEFLFPIGIHEHILTC